MRGEEGKDRERKDDFGLQTPRRFLAFFLSLAYSFPLYPRTCRCCPPALGSPDIVGRAELGLDREEKKGAERETKKRLGLRRFD